MKTTPLQKDGMQWVVLMVSIIIALLIMLKTHSVKERLLC